MKKRLMVRCLDCGQAALLSPKTGDSKRCPHCDGMIVPVGIVHIGIDMAEKGGLNGDIQPKKARKPGR